MALFFDLLTVPSAAGTYRGTGYFAGTGEGLLTAGGQPAQRTILCYRAQTHEFVCRTESLTNGHWLIPALNPDITYRIIAADSQGDYQPVGWDNIKPANDLSPAAQRELWDSWQA